MFSNRVDRLHEATKQLFWRCSFCKTLPGVQDGIY